MIEVNGSRRHLDRRQSVTILKLYESGRQDGSGNEDVRVIRRVRAVTAFRCVPGRLGVIQRCDGGSQRQSSNVLCPGLTVPKDSLTDESLSNQQTLSENCGHWRGTLGVGRSLRPATRKAQLNGYRAAAATATVCQPCVHDARNPLTGSVRQQVILAQHSRLQTGSNPRRRLCLSVSAQYRACAT